MKFHDSQIDPFNAGEPIMPWDMPETDIGADAEPCTLPEKDYDSPTKKRSSYEAPKSKKSKRAATSPAKRTKGAKSSGSSKTGSPSLADTGKAMRVALETARTSVASTVATSARGKRSTGKKTSGCGFLFTVVFFLLIGSGLLAAVPSCARSMIRSAGELFDSVDSSDFFSSFDDPDDDYTWSPATDPAELNEEELGLYYAAQARLDRLVQCEDDTDQLIVEHFSNSTEDFLDFTPEELGLDPDAYAMWLLSDVSYTIDDICCFPNDSEPYATVYATLSMRDANDFEAIFFNDAIDYRYGDAFDGAETSLTDEQRAEFQRIFQEAMDEAEFTENTVRVVFHPEDGGWTLDEENFGYELEYPFSLY